MERLVVQPTVDLAATTAAGQLSPGLVVVRVLAGLALGYLLYRWQNRGR